jgi:osomolarity two-component system response regulator SKN7
MANSRHNQWPPLQNSQGGSNSTGSSPANLGQGPSTTSYTDPSHHANGAFRPMMNARYNGSGYTSHSQASQPPPNLPSRGFPSPQLPPGGYGTSAASHPQQHVGPSVFADPRAANQSNTPGNYYSNYGQNQTLPSPYSQSSPSYYPSPGEPNHSLNHPHPPPLQQHYGASPWASNSPSSSSFHGHESGPYGGAKSSANTPYGHSAAQPYKPSDGYMQSMDSMGYPSQMYQSEAQAQIKTEVEDDEIDGDEPNEDDGPSAGKRARTQTQKGTSEFVKKLFRMLDDTSYAHIVSWGPHRDSFIVKDMNDFTKHVLPRHFRHSNFASFVRQLNKYDFHKVKKPEDPNQQHLGVDQMWEFRHPAFLQGREDMLENVKRKLPTGKKIGGKDKGEDSPREQSPTMPGTSDAAEKGAEDYTKLKEQVAILTASQDQMTSHINNLTKQYQGVIGEMLTFQKNMVQQDQLMQNLIQYLMNLEADRKIDSVSYQSGRDSEASSRPQLENNGAFVSSRDAERLVTNFSDVAKESFGQMSEISHRAAKDNGMHFGSVGSTATSSATTAMGGYGDSSTAGTSNQGNISPKSVASHDTPLPMDSGYTSDKGKSKSMMSDDQIPSVFFHPPHHDMNPGNSPSSGEHKDLFNAAANAVNNPSLAGFEGAGLRVFTVGTLQPRSNSDAAGLEPDGSSLAAAALEKAFLRSSTSSSEDEDSKPYGISVPNLENLPAGMPRVDGRSTSTAATSSIATPLNLNGQDGQLEGTESPGEGSSNMLRVRRSTYVPGWAVPPKVLVVDDDDVCRKLGSKFLQVFGCAIDVAVDGVTAVNKMNLEKYDLVLMDIVMPNLDGVSATSLIREFDPRTPIISMTSNSAPNELLSYMSSGMNDVLPKPFTKDGLLNMLEKHLIHLKTVQKMDEIPKSLGLPPISEDMMQSVLSATAASAASMASTPHGEVNSMAAMMGNGPQAMRASQDAGASMSDFGQGEDEEGIANPLAGMGFSDEEYISMLQNLIAAGAVSDSTRGETADNVASVMGVTRGEGTQPTPRSKESTPLLRSSSTGKKRSAVGDAATDGPEEKRSRFTEVHV